ARPRRAGRAAARDQPQDSVYTYPANPRQARSTKPRAGSCRRPARTRRVGSPRALNGATGFSPTADYERTGRRPRLNEMAVCPSCGEENPDRFRHCGFCGALLHEETPPEEERKPITVLFVDMVGSTARGEELDPEDVRALLEPYYARLRAALERHGGTVEKFIGDAVVAVFGAPIAHEDDPERAVRAGLAILDEIEGLNEEDPTRRLEVRVGINTGEALVALAARVSEGQGMAWGDVMNTAARIQSAAPVNGVLVDERTYAAAAKAIEFEAADPI